MFISLWVGSYSETGDGSTSRHIAIIEICENIKSALFGSINELDMHFLLF